MAIIFVACAERTAKTLQLNTIISIFSIWIPYTNERYRKPHRGEYLSIQNHFVIIIQQLKCEIKRKTYWIFLECNRMNLIDKKKKTNQLIKKMLTPAFAEQIRQQINDNATVNDPKHYGGEFNVINDKGTSHISILAKNGDAISVTSSINTQ